MRAGERAATLMDSSRRWDQHEGMHRAPIPMVKLHRNPVLAWRAVPSPFCWVVGVGMGMGDY